jgi:hypothetical protein
MSFTTKSNVKDLIRSTDSKNIPSDPINKVNSKPTRVSKESKASKVGKVRLLV